MILFRRFVIPVLKPDACARNTFLLPLFALQHIWLEQLVSENISGKWMSRGSRRNTAPVIRAKGEMQEEERQEGKLKI